jgi:hypothetical protein
MRCAARRIPTPAARDPPAHRRRARVRAQDGFSAAVTSVVVSSDRRGTGLGRTLLGHAEAMASRCGYGYLYLWTHDAGPFYEACGYQECEKVSLLRPALVALGSEAVNKLEALFQRRASDVSRAAGEGANADDAAAEATVRADSTWYRKRLLELHAASRPLSREALLAAVHEALPNVEADDGASSAAWSVHLTDVAWERQVGPCCGLAALRMARSALHPALRPTPPAPPAAAPTAAAGTRLASWGATLGGQTELTLAGDVTAPHDASVLTAAIEKGFSSDGEVFDVHDLAALAADPCGLDGAVVALSEPAAESAGDGGTAAEAAAAEAAAGESAASLAAAAATFARGVSAWLACGGVAVVPYDKDEANHMPALRQGKMAHYLIVVGCATSATADVPPRLIALHGLSRRPLVLEAAELLTSNAQLTRMKQSVNTKRWVVKGGGPRLARRLLLLAAPGAHAVELS